MDIKPRQYKFNNSTLTVVFGNILDSEAEVIVSSDDSYIHMGGGVSMALLNKGGREILNDAKKKTPAPLGGIVVSTAGTLKLQKFLFHAITIDYDYVMSNLISDVKEFYGSLAKKLKIEDGDVCAYIVRNAVNHSFLLLKSLNLNSIAFPMLGSGTAQLPIKDVANNMFEEIGEHLMQTSKVLNVELYIYNNFNFTIEDYFDLFEGFASKAATIANTHKLYLDSDIKIYNDGDREEVINNNPIPNNFNVFISYSRKDSKTVDMICKVLDESGITYWIDRNGYYSGQNYVHVLVDAIKVAKVVLFVSSEASNKSEIVHKEIRYALAQRKTIIPVRIDDTPINEYLSFDLNYIDNIQYDGSEEAKKNICTNIKLITAM